jgi:hypothetical protein
LRILHLVTGCRYRIEADEGEEDHARGRGDPGHALVPEAVKVIGVECGERDDDEHRQHAELDQHHDGVDESRLAGTADQQRQVAPTPNSVSWKVPMLLFK